MTNESNMSNEGLASLKKLHKRELPYNLQLSITQGKPQPQGTPAEQMLVTVQAQLTLLEEVQDLAGKTVQPAERSVTAYGVGFTIEQAQLKATENAMFLAGIK